MHMVRLIKGALLAGTLGLAAAQAPAQAPAAESAAGHFIAVIGDVQVLGKGGGRRLAVRNGKIQPGESIVTGRDSLAQLRMSDGGALSVRSETQITLDAYRYSGHKDPGDNFLVSILRGGFRTITGLIARNYRDNYRVQTSAMTIGVRGTDFEVVHVLAPTADAVPGTYNRVYAGITTMQGRSGPAVLANRSQTFFVPLSGDLPPAPVLPPASLFGKPTPVPPAAPQARRDDAPQGDAGKGEGRGIRTLPAVQEKAQDRLQESAPATVPVKSMTAPLLNPIDSPRVLETAPATTTISPTLTSPTKTTISPTLISPTTTTTSPTTTTVSPTLTSPATTTISPTLTSPTTTTISPTLISPTTTTVSPTLTSPTTTTISPTLISPTTTTISPTLTSPATTTISPTTTTISPTLTSPTTTTIIKR
jgi:FecR protein